MKPNILYINSHDTGRYIQPYGRDVETPNLQKLADSGVLFKNNFCISPTCSPSRGALLTGTYPHINGLTGLVHRGFALNNYNDHILHTLKKEGYTTVLAGIQHVHNESDKEYPFKIGYDKHLSDPDNNRTDTHLEVAEFLNKKHDKPFFISAGFWETHRAYPELLEDEKTAISDSIPPSHLPETSETKEDFARFKKMATELDRKMGIIFDTLEKTGLAKNTIVICTTDHGIAFPKMKCTLSDAGCETMLIIKGPGFENSKEINCMTTHMDIFPTICDILNIEKPRTLEGTSLLPLLNGEKDNLHKEIFAQVNFHAAYEPIRSIRTDNWKYIRRFDNRTKPVMCNIDPSMTKTYLKNENYFNVPVPEEQLFDLVNDPSEQNNLINSMEHTKTLNDLQNRLRIHMERTSDPLLKGPMPLPKKSKMDDPDSDKKDVVID